MPKNKRSLHGGVFRDDQLAALAFDTLVLMRRRWFADVLHPQVDHHMATLLIATYAYLKRREPLHKNIVWDVIGVRDTKTARKYIAQAEKLGLIKIEPSPTDRRKELLFPTARLEEIIAEEFRASAAIF